MNLEDIQDLLGKINGATFAGLDTVTSVALKGGKKNPMQGEITKHCYGHNVMLFTNKKNSGYDLMVRRRLEKEGKDPSTFILGALKWGQRLPNSPIIEHNGKYYIQVIFISAGAVEYMRSGWPIEKLNIEGLDEKPESADQGGLDNKVIVRTYALDSIKAIRIMGEEIK